MPIYEYQCNQCGHALEKLQKLSEPNLVDCPACDEPALQKMVSAPRFRLKGTGWYETDFKNKDKPQAESASTSSQAAQKPATPSSSPTPDKDSNAKQSASTGKKTTETAS